MISLAVLALALQASPAASPSPQPTPKPVPRGPVVLVDTTLGSFKIALHQDKAPVSVDNFLKYARSKFYEGTIFHRVIPGFMIQGGGMDAQAVEKQARPPIRNEASNGLRNTRGSVAMARTNDPNSATAQFFVNVKDNPGLDFGIRGAGYAVFGEVVEGMDVVDKIVAGETTTKAPHLRDFPVKPVVIKSVREMGVSATAPPPPPLTTPKPSPTADPKP